MTSSRSIAPIASRSKPSMAARSAVSVWLMLAIAR
jgi:hypothetical protein